MQNTTNHWKIDTADLRARASTVADEPADRRMGARAMARVLSGVVGVVARRFSVDVMQRACAELARFDAAWGSNLRTLPSVRPDVDAAMSTIAPVARGLLGVTRAADVRAALAFWATETDPAVWQSISGIAA